MQGKFLNHVRGRMRIPASTALPSSASEKPRSEPEVERALDLRELALRRGPLSQADSMRVLEGIAQALAAVHALGGDSPCKRFPECQPTSTHLCCFRRHLLRRSCLSVGGYSLEMIWTELDTKTFFDQGILALRGFLPRKLTVAARDSILSELTRLKLKVNGKIVSSKIQDLPVFQQIARLGQMVGWRDEVDRLFSIELVAAMNALAGTKLKPAHSHPQILLSFPHKADWSLSHLNWHLDLTPPKADQIPGVQAFFLIDDVQPQGGATLALAGSHKLHYVSRECNAHEILGRSSDLGSTPEKYLEPQEIEGTRIQIVEMSGRAGDVYLMDLRVLHSPSINARRNIRMMATNRYLK